MTEELCVQKTPEGLTIEVNGYRLKLPTNKMRELFLILKRELAGEKPYVMKTDAQHVVGAYKEAIGVKFDDRLWDKGNFARASKTAEELVKWLGGREKAVAAIHGVKAWANGSGLSWTIETVLKRAADWKAGRLVVSGAGRNGGRPAPTVPRIQSASEVMRAIEETAAEFAEGT